VFRYLSKFVTLLLVFLWIVLTTLPTPVLAKATNKLGTYAQTLSSSDVQLKGYQDQVATSIDLQHSAPVAISINWGVSSMVDAERSVLNVLVNGQYRATRTLASLGGQPWHLQL